MSDLTANAGHSALTPGAFGNGYAEHILARQIKNDFIAITGAHDSTSEIAGQTAILADQVAKANASGASLGISFHLDSVEDQSATGTTVFYWEGSVEGKRIATALAASISGALGIRNRGAKPTTSLYWIRNTRMTAVLVEVGFISNPTDINAIARNPRAVAAAAATALGYKVNTEPAVPAPTGTNAFCLIHATMEVAMREFAVPAWGKGFASVPTAVGEKITGGWNVADALNYVTKNGRSAREMFSAINETAHAALGTHCTIAHADIMEARAKELELAFTREECGSIHAGFRDMSSAITYALEVGCSIPEVFGK